MTRLILSSAVLGLVLGLSGSASAFDWFSGPQADVYATSNLPLVNIGGCDCGGGNDCGCNGGCNNGCGDDCCSGNCGGCIIEADLLFLKFHRNFSFATDNTYDYDPSIRVVVGTQNACGLGARVRFWDYNHSGLLGGALPVSVDTLNIDAELFQTVQLTDTTSIELSGGIRYNDFEELFVVRSSFQGFGGIAGLKGRVQLGPGQAYANVNHAILMDDFRLGGAAITFYDQVVSQTEIGSGYELVRYTDGGAKVWLKAGFEWWMWTGYTPIAVVGGSTEIGFGGFVLGGGAQF